MVVPRLWRLGGLSANQLKPTNHFHCQTYHAKPINQLSRHGFIMFHITINSIACIIFLDLSRIAIICDMFLPKALRSFEFIWPHSVDLRLKFTNDIQWYQWYPQSTSFYHDIPIVLPWFPGPDDQLTSLVLRGRLRPRSPRRRRARLSASSAPKEPTASRRSMEDTPPIWKKKSRDNLPSGKLT